MIQILKQFRDTTLQSLGFIRRGKLLGGFYWFYVRNKVSLFGNRAGTKPDDVYRLSAPLVRDGFMELGELSKKTVSELEHFFLNEQDILHNSISDYFAGKKSGGFVRPKGVDVALNKQLIAKVFAELELIPKIKEYLDLSEKDIFFSAKIDSLIQIDVGRELVNGYDDALEFHRDVDSLAFVKVFSYLVDVNKGCGEHEVCLGSHRKLPIKMRPIRRYTFNELKNKLPRFELKSVYGSSGYSWIEDTLTFHRGTIPTNGNRLILSLSFNDAKSAKRIYEEEYYPLETIALPS